MEIQRIWCNRCQRNLGHLRATMNHWPHLLGTIVTGGLWLIGWLLTGVFVREEPWFCMSCGSQYSTPQKRENPAALPDAETDSQT